MNYRVICKYRLEISGEQELYMPAGAGILTLQTQRDVPHLWALVNPDNPTEARLFETFGTGHPVPEDAGVERRYIGTYQRLNGDLVFHVFERLN